jgi:hypothetical protein
MCWGVFCHLELSASCGDAVPSPDGILATDTWLCGPTGVAVESDGSIYTAEWNYNRIRQVGPDGILRTVAGDGGNGYSGEGVPATQAHVSLGAILFK